VDAAADKGDHKSQQRICCCILAASSRCVRLQEQLAQQRQL
jgi:hypothetical protein